MEPFSPKSWSAATIADPYPVYRRYREAEPVHQASPGTWYVFGHDPVAQVLTGKAFGRNAPAHLSGRGDDALRASVANWLVFLDPPRHTRLRRLLAARFTPAVVAALRPRVAAIAAGLMGALTPGDEVDLVAEFAAPLPLMVIAELLGVPGDRHAWFRERALWLQGASSARMARQSGSLGLAESAVRELTEHFAEHVALRRSGSGAGTDLVSLLSTADGLTDEEITATCVHLLSAGHETTTNLIGKAVLALAERPALADELRARPGLTRVAVEELVRFDPPVQMVTRWATTSQTLLGRRIAEGDKVVAVLGAANRDPGAFPCPDEVRLDRDDGRQVGFGLGVHYCLGASLARAELEVTLPLLLDQIATREVRRVRYAEDVVFHGPESLTLSPRSPAAQIRSAREPMPSLRNTLRR
ncbi:cytochrome P450 [Lentzea sp. NPDC059081]|uniref:cytochrome P450 n=1 Tax=Lentzea sp. NPDC059081 TaxID=3346719 RepID=UPI0036A1FD40